MTEVVTVDGGICAEALLNHLDGRWPTGWPEELSLGYLSYEPNR